MRFPRKVKDYNVFEDGISYAGLVASATMPNVNIMIERFRGAGMDGGSPIDLGIEDLESSMVFAQWMPRIIKLPGNRGRFTLRPTEMSDAGDFDAQAFITTIGGLWSGSEFPELDSGKSDANHTVTCAVDYLRMVYRGEELFEIDIRAGKRVIGGRDQLAAKRTAMGF